MTATMSFGHWTSPTKTTGRRQLHKVLLQVLSFSTSDVTAYRHIMVLLLFTTFLTSLITPVSSEESVLYQSDFRNVHDWNKQSMPGRYLTGWEAIPKDGVYRTCDVANLDNAENLQSALTRNFTKSAEAPKIHIEADLHITPCSEIAANGGIKPGCRESVKLEVNFRDSENKHQTKTLDLEDEITLKAVEFPPGVTDFYISLIDEGVCADLSRFKISHFVCPPKIQNLIRYKETISTNEIKQTVLECVENAQSDRLVKAHCIASGVWMGSQNFCQCLPGYEPDADLQLCQGCSQGYYKTETGNQMCKQCPLNSHALYSHATECSCAKNYARKNPHDPSLACYRQPDAPRSPKARVTTHSRATLLWSPPYVSQPGMDPTWYTVHCEEPQNACQGMQGIRTNDTQVTVENLRDNTHFKWKICSENSVSRFVASDSNCASVVFETLKIIRVENPVMETMNANGDSQLALIWSEPLGMAPSSGGYSHLYKVRIQTPHNDVIDTAVNGSHACVNRRCSYALPKTFPPGDYQFQVGVGNPTVFSQPPLHVPISSNMQFKGEIRRLMITVGLLFAVLLMVLASCIAIFCCCRQKIDQTYPRIPKTMSGYYPEQFSTIAPPTLGDYPLKLTGCGAGFVEPCTHPDPDILLAKHARELSDDQILSNFQQLKGKFTEAVELGSFSDESLGSGKTEVGLQHFIANQSSSSNSASLDQFDLQARRELVIAAATCAQLIHPNVLSLKGFIKRGDESITIVTEHAELGPLLPLLQQNQVTNVSQLIHMARGIACGMRYLQEEGYIHKVLKSANILVSQNLVCKISGFAQRAKIQSLEKNANLMIPEDLIPWTAPEVLLYQQFTWASDSWSFGILLWEMLSQGSTPYYDQEIPATQILAVLEIGHRLPPPMQCPQLAYELMNQCWAGEGNKRPQFSTIVEVLEALMKKPLDLAAHEQYNTAAFDNTSWYPSSNYSLYSKALALSSPGAPTISASAFRPPISPFLAQINMHECESLFLMAGIQTIEEASRLSNQDLKTIGINSSKQRKRLLHYLSKVTISKPPSYNIDMYSGYSTLRGKSWNPAQPISPTTPREQIMSQYV